MSDATEASVSYENRAVGTEAGKTIADKVRNGFVARFLSGANILDIGYRGYLHEAVPIVPQAIGIDLNYPGYDGKTLPFADNSQDAVFSSHCLEHIDDYQGALREWHRVLRVGGFMVIAVPHQFLYEKKASLPSRWNQDHKRFYTPASLMAEVESALEPNSYRLRHLVDNDAGFTYSIPPEQHSGGSYEIEMVIEKIARPAWKVSNLVHISVEPQSDLVTWIGFGPCEHARRWTDGTSASIQFSLTPEAVRAATVDGACILLWFDTAGSQRIRASLNEQPVHDAVHLGQGLVLELATSALRPGANTLRLDLPDATHPVSETDTRCLGIAIRSIRLLRAAAQDEAVQPSGGLLRTVLSALKRA